MLRLAPDVYREMVAHCLDELPHEGCGLLAGPSGAGVAVACYPTRNVAASARLYEVDPLQHLHADRDAEARGMEIVGAFHSHTHTDAYPSPTDVDQVADPGLHYVIVSLRHGIPSARAFRIVDGTVTEEPLLVEGL